MVANIGTEIIGNVLEQIVVDIALIVIIVNINIFCQITINKHPIDCKGLTDYKNLANYASFLI